MVEKVNNNLVPEQFRGAANDLQEERNVDTDARAILVYERAVSRLFNPACWKDIAGELGVEFCQMDPNGRPLEGMLEDGDFIRIDLPGPGPGAGEGYDWVQVTLIEKDEHVGRSTKRAALQVMTAPEPGTSESEAAHFFEKGATSTFMVEREGSVVRSRYFGRNEVSNNKTDDAGDNVRNSIVSSAAKLGVSRIQWNSLLKGLLCDS